MTSVRPFDLEQQICFRSPEAAEPLIQRLDSAQLLLCLRYEKMHHNRPKMLTLLHRYRVARLFAELENPPVLLTREEAEKVTGAINLARSHIQCGAPTSTDTQAELSAALSLLNDAVNAPA